MESTNRHAALNPETSHAMLAMRDLGRSGPSGMVRSAISMLSGGWGAIERARAVLTPAHRLWALLGDRHHG